MATLASTSSVTSGCSPPSEPPYHCLSLLPRSFVRFNTNSRSLKPQRLVVVSCSSSASSSSSFEDLSSRDSSRSKKSVLSDLIHEIEPLDVSLIQKDVPLATVEAMKRTISGMLGLLPSNQFQVLIEALWEPLSKLLVSSMMTGYTLRNAEYRLCLERNLGIYEENIEQNRTEGFDVGLQKMLLDSVRSVQIPTGTEASPRDDGTAKNQHESVNLQGLGDMSPEAQSYILQLRSRLFSVKKELHEVKRKNAALQMQQFVGEEKNDLLDYLRSLQPEKLAELSEPASPELKETIHSVVHGLLATLSPKMHSKAPPFYEKNTAGAVNVGNEDCAELVENTSLNFQPIIALTRDYLARLIFWCMLLGHYLRGLEYRTELMDLFSLSSKTEDGANGAKPMS